MASSGSFLTSGYYSSSKGDTVCLKFSWEITSQSTANNTTTISWKLTGYRTASGYINAGGFKVTIDGDTVYSVSTDDRINLYNGTVVASGTKTLTHKSDGTRTFEAYAEGGIYYYSVNCTGSDTFTLDAIARASSVSASNGTLGTEQTLTVTQQSSSFTHTIQYTCGDTSGTIVTKSNETSIKWTPPLSLAQQNTTGTSVSIKLTITTYNGSTKVGNAKSTTFTASIPSSVAPTCAVAVTDPMGYKDTYGKFIKGLSKFKVVVTPTLAQASPIASYSTAANGSTYTDASFTTAALKSSGTLTVTATVKDQRGRSGSKSVECSVYDYNAPSINSMSVARCDSAGKASSSGAYLRVKFSAEATSLDDQNGVKYTIQYKKSTETDYKSVELTDYASIYSVSDGMYIFAADTASSYNVILTVEDDFYSGDTAKTKSATGPSISKLWSILAKGKGFAFGKIAELSGYFDVAWKSMFRDHIYLTYDKSIYGINANGEERNVFKPFSSNGNTIVGYSNYENADANTNIYGKDINFFVAAAGNANYKPYYGAGDSIAVNYYGAGLLTSSKGQVRFTLPLSKPIIGSPTVAISADTGFVLRQNENYTHGSAASTYVKPDSYTFTITESGIVVKATFSDTTNAINNDTIGIEWVATLALS